MYIASLAEDTLKFPDLLTKPKGLLSSFVESYVDSEAGGASLKILCNISKNVRRF